MRGLRLAMMVPMLLSPSMAALAAQTKVAVFEFELIDTSLEGAMNGPRADEQRRLARLADELRGRLAASGRYAPVDLSPGRRGGARKQPAGVWRLRCRIGQAGGRGTCRHGHGSESIQFDPQHEHLRP